MDANTIAALILSVIAILGVGYLYANPAETDVDLSGVQDNANTIAALKGLSSSHSNSIDSLALQINKISTGEVDEDDLDDLEDDINDNQDDIDDNQDDINDIIDCANDNDNYEDFADCVNNI